MARIARDGKPFDVDNVVGEPSEEEVEVIQFLRPDGTRRRMLAKVGKAFVDAAEDMVLTCEELTTGEVALYARWKDQPEHEELCAIAKNGPGVNSPTSKLKDLIASLYAKGARKKKDDADQDN